jgi:hypothetical protein
MQKESDLAAASATDLTDEQYNSRLIRVFVEGAIEERYDTEQIPDMLSSLCRCSGENNAKGRRRLIAQFFHESRIAGLSI